LCWKREDFINGLQLKLAGVSLLEEKHDKIENPEIKEETLDKEESSSDNSDDIAIDFSKIKNIFSRKKKVKSAEKEVKNKNLFSGDKKDTEDSISFDGFTKFYKKNSKWLIPLILILMVISVSTYLRMMPSYLPATDDWAENTVHNFYRNNIQGQINQQYPNLPQQNREALINKEFQKILEDNSKQIDQEIAQVSQQFKSNFQDDNGDTYLLAIDPYLWLSQARNVINYGHLGDTLVNGEPHFSLRDGRLDKKSSVQLHPYIGAYLYKILHFFNPNISIMRAMFLLPVILIALAIIATFFIARRIGGNTGGFFAALFLAINGPLLGRTPAGFADTDAYNVLLPLLIGWLFIEAYYAKTQRQRIIFGSLSGLFVGVFAATWSGWPFAFLFVLAAALIVFGLNAIFTTVRHKKIVLKDIIQRNKSLFIVVISYLVSAGVFVTLFQSSRVFWKSFVRPIQFITLKEVGIKSIWPNVLTTVAEFNTTSFSGIIRQMGGVFLFTLAVVGVFILATRKDKDGKFDPFYFTILVIWFFGTAYAFTKGTRFAILITPAFAIALGSFSGFTYEKASKWFTKGINLDHRVSKTVIIVLLCMLLITPISTAKSIAISEIPSMNDAWYDTLTKISNDSPDSIITSWWDFGHWFVAIAERRVTFDGGDQGERIHWVGNSLLTDKEEESIGILRMLNCAQETATHKLDEFTGDSLQSVEILYDVIPISSRTKAYQKYQQLGLTKEQATIMLDYTHCTDLLPNYYITSEDMVGKAGVWGHFGSWNFEKASMYQNTVKSPRIEAVQYLTENFDLTEEEAHRLHNEIYWILVIITSLFEISTSCINSATKSWSYGKETGSKTRYNIFTRP